MREMTDFARAEFMLPFIWKLARIASLTLEQLTL
jgi:hypothetical protein